MCYVIMPTAENPVRYTHILSMFRNVALFGMRLCVRVLLCALISHYMHNHRVLNSTELNRTEQSRTHIVYTYVHAIHSTSMSSSQPASQPFHSRIHFRVDYCLMNDQKD